MKRNQPSLKQLNQFKGENRENQSSLSCIMRMAKTCYPSSKTIIVILIIIMTSGSMNPVDAAARASITAETKIKHWCLARPASDQALNDILRYVCVDMKIDCSPIIPGAPCYDPNTLDNHASFAMNRYFQSRGQEIVNCDFSGNGVIVFTDPSYVSSQHPYRRCTYDQRYT